MFVRFEASRGSIVDDDINQETLFLTLHVANC